jgi:repressor LexA
MAEVLSEKKRQILDFIERALRERGYPPSVREIGEAVGLTSSSTVHSHLSSLQQMGYLRRDPTKPRAIEVRYDPASGAIADRRPVRHVPLIGEVAAGTDVLAEENVEELHALSEDFTGADTGQLFMLKVRGDSMVDAGIFEGDYVVVRQQAEVRKGDVVVAGIPGDEATVKTYSRRGNKVVLTPSNPRFEPMELDPADVNIYGKVVTVVRRL